MDAVDAGISERVARRVAGAIVLPVGLAVVGAGAALVSSSRPLGVVLLVVGLLALSDLTAVAPGQARVVSLFGRYEGTLRTNGLQRVKPLTKRQRVSTRIRNHET